MHPDIYRDLARHHLADLDREAARVSLAATVRRGRQPAGAASPWPARQLGIPIRTGFPHGVLIQASRVLLEIERRIALAVADLAAPDEVR